MNSTQAKALNILNVQLRQSREKSVDDKISEMRRSFVSDNELEEITLGFLRSRRETGYTEAELDEVINTVIADRFLAICSELAGKGVVDVELDKSKPEGHRITFKWRDDLTDEENASIAKICREQHDKSVKHT